MATSNPSHMAQHIRRKILDFCWGVWSELGVSGWGRTHQNWAIDPEPLIVFTAGIADWDPRLRDETTDWCIRNSRFISQARLRNILLGRVSQAMSFAINNNDSFLDKWGKFAATVNHSAGTRWPKETSPRRYTPTGRSTLRALTEPAMVILRLRSLFGLGARAEIFGYLIMNQERASAATLAERTSYRKRIVAKECDALAQTGALLAHQVRNRFYYSVANPAALQEFVGELPLIAPHWTELLHVIELIRQLAELSQSVSKEVLTVETHQVAQEIEKDLDLLGVEKPKVIRGAAFLEVWNQWASSLVDQLASGHIATKS